MSAKYASTKPPFRVFFAATVVVFFLSLSAADSIGLVPYYIDGTTPLTTGGTAPKSDTEFALSDLPELGDTPEADASADAAVATALPARVLISSIGLDLAVQNPGTRDLAALDELLKQGPARYVDSAKLGEVGNMIVFAHSSHLPIVHNQMYKAFNRLPELAAGDMITLQADGKNYLYAVQSVRTADANDTRIDMSKEKGTRLTLVTCDTLTGKSARFVVEASFVGSYGI